LPQTLASPFLSGTGKPLNAGGLTVTPTATEKKALTYIETHGAMIALNASDAGRKATNSTY
jgi:hypothetical protein